MRKFSEEKCSKLGKEKSELVNQLDENEEELQEVIRKYKTSVNTISQDQLTIQKQTSQIQELELGSKKLKEQLTELSRKLEDMNQGSEENSEKTTADVQKLELRVKDLETKLGAQMKKLRAYVPLAEQHVDAMHFAFSKTRLAGTST